VESSPVIAGNRAFAATTAGKLYLIDLPTGETKWEYDAGGGFTASPAVVDGRIIIGNTDGTLYCFGEKN
jgi:outer membrane protein assembly factor BamB